MFLHVNMCAPAFHVTRCKCLKDIAANTTIDSAHISFTLIEHLLLASLIRQVFQKDHLLPLRRKAFPQVRVR